MAAPKRWKSSKVFAVIMCFGIFPCTRAWANPTIRTAWVTRYGSTSSSYTNLSLGCNLCHTAGGGSNWNSYGWAVRQQIHSGATTDQAFTNVEALNSDNNPGGQTNLQEIQASAQPGWTVGPNNTYYYTSSTSTNQMPAALVTGTYDPVPLCLPDITGDTVVNVSDLLAVINAWGGCPSLPAPCSADITRDGAVNVGDLLAVINAWGACP